MMMHGVGHESSVIMSHMKCVGATVTFGEDTADGGSAAETAVTRYLISSKDENV